MPGQPGANAMVDVIPDRQRVQRRPPRPRRAGPAGTSRRRSRCGTRAASTSAPRGGRTRRSSPTRTWAWPTSSSPTARGCTSTTPTRSTPRPRCTNPLDRGALGQGGRAGDGRGRAAGPRPCRAARRSSCTRTTPTTRARRYGAHENYLMRRSTPFADIVRHLTPFFVSRQVVCGAGRVGIGAGRPRARVPDQPARRLLRGRGRAGDHAQAADHQHPRRAARRRRRSTAGCT